MSSQQRRTAFARVPRYQNTAQQPAARKVVINREYIDAMNQAQMSPDLSAVLTRTASTLNIEIQSNGRGNVSVQKNGVVLADSSDIQRIGMLGSFINNERKAVLKESVAGKALRFIAAMVSNSGKDRLIPVPITKIDDTFLDAYRVVRAQLDILVENLSRIEQTPAEGEGNNLVRDHLIESGRRIFTAATYYLVHRTKPRESSEENRKMNKFLAEAGIMSWVFSRLTSQRLQLGAKDFEYRRLYYPKDPTKGIYLHFEELQNERIREHQIGLFEQMKPFVGLLSEKFVKEFCSIPAHWDFGDFSESSDSKILKNIPIFLVPSLSMYPEGEILQVLGKLGDRGLAWNSGAGSSVQDMLRFLGTVPKRIAFGNLTRPYSKIGLLTKMFPGLNIDNSSLENRGVYAQLYLQFRAGQIDTKYFDTIRRPKKELDSVFEEVVRTTLEIGDDKLEDLLKHAVQLKTQQFLPGVNPRGLHLLQQIEDSARLMTDDDAKQILNGIMFIPKKKQIKDPDGIRLARSLLTPESKSLLAMMKSKGYVALAVRVEKYLRSFLTDVVQSAVSGAIAAKLDASLAHPVLYDKEDFINVIDYDITDFQDTPDIEMAEDDPPQNPDEQ